MYDVIFYRIGPWCTTCIQPLTLSHCQQGKNYGELCTQPNCCLATGQLKSISLIACFLLICLTDLAHVIFDKNEHIGPLEYF